jgi:GT2 family glycosyltransferase
MDDDLEPQGDCLEALLSEVTPGTPRVVLPTRSSEVGHSDLNRGWYGCLIPAQVVRAVGGPRADFFWWAEDVEFFIRVRTAGFPVVTSPRAGVWHRLHRAPRDYPAWKLYYEARNSLYYRLHLRRNRSKFVQSLIKIIVRTAVMLPRRGNRMKRLAMTFRGCRDGIAGRLGKTVDPVRS